MSFKTLIHASAGRQAPQGLQFLLETYPNGDVYGSAGVHRVVEDWRAPLIRMHMACMRSGISFDDIYLDGEFSFIASRLRLYEY